MHSPYIQHATILVYQRVLRVLPVESISGYARRTIIPRVSIIRTTIIYNYSCIDTRALLCYSARAPAHTRVYTK
jgi:hypothetical protein